MSKTNRHGISPGKRSRAATRHLDGGQAISDSAKRPNCADEAQLALARWLLVSAVAVYGGQGYPAPTSEPGAGAASPRPEKRGTA